MRLKVIAALLLAAAVALPAAAEAASKESRHGHAAASPDAGKGAAQNAAAARDEAIARAFPWVKTLTRRTGLIDIPEGDVRLDMGTGYYFLGPEDSRKVLVDGWGNPPSEVEGVLGMIFPQGMSPMQNGSWGVVVTWNGTGYVNDKDAKDIKPDELLKSLREGEQQDNDARVKAGYKPMHLVGWVEPPAYDPAHHVVIWAQELESDGIRSANYDVRVLGRKGTLSLKIIGNMDSYAAIKAAADGVRNTAAFNAGARYTDFKPGLDKTAGYGVAGLVAAGLGLAAVKKAGLIGVILLFAKKGIALIVAGFAGVAAWFRNLFSGGKGKTKSAALAPPADQGPVSGSLNLGDPPPQAPAAPPPSSGDDIVS